MTKKEKKENNRRRKMFLAILMILFTGVVFTSSTYAWFTANKTVTVDKIDVKVGAESGLQLSTNASTWKPVISNTDITGAISNGYAKATNQLPLALDHDSPLIVPVSTGGAINESGQLDMFKGTIAQSDGQYILTSTKEPAEVNTTTKGSYIAFDLFFSTSEANPMIYLTNASSVSITNQEGPKGLQNSARVAFVVEGHGAPGTGATELQALKAGAGSQATNLYIWEPNYDTHTAAAVKHAKDTYQIETGETGGKNLDYIGVKAEFGQEAKVPLNQKPGDGGNGLHFMQHKAGEHFFSTPAAGISAQGYQPLFRINAGVTKVRVYMWIEGQDVDCENDASGASISFDLQFSMNAKA